MKTSTNTTRRRRRLLVSALAFAAIVAPAASAGTDTGIGVPAGRDAVYAGPPVKGENYFARGLISSPTPAAPAPVSTRFQWSDAGIGAGSALVVVGLAGGAMVVFRRQRNRLTTS